MIGRHDGRVDSLVFHPEEDILASGGDDRMVKIWDVVAHELSHEFRAHEDSIVSMEWVAAAGFLVTGSQDRSISLWEIDDGYDRYGSPINLDSGQVRSLAVRDGTRLVHAAGVDLIEWNLDGGDWAQLGCSVVNRTFNQEEWAELLDPANFMVLCPVDSS